MTGFDVAVISVPYFIMLFVWAGSQYENYLLRKTNLAYRARDLRLRKIAQKYIDRHQELRADEIFEQTLADTVN